MYFVSKFVFKCQFNQKTNACFQRGNLGKNCEKNCGLNILLLKMPNMVFIVSDTQYNLTKQKAKKKKGWNKIFNVDENDMSLN